MADITPIHQDKKVKSNLQKIAETEKRQLQSFRTASLKEQNKGINRYSEMLVEFCDDIHPRAWRALTYIMSKIELYPLQALMADDDGTYFERHCKGLRTFNSQYRTIELYASEYGERYSPGNLAYSGKLFRDDMEMLCSEQGKLKPIYYQNGDEHTQIEVSYPLIEARALVKMIKSQDTVTVDSFDKCTSLYSCIIVLADITSLMMLFQMSNFTRIDQHITNEMDTATKKIYETIFCLLDMERIRLQRNKKKSPPTCIKTHNLEKWNTILGSKSSTLSRLKTRLQKIVNYINDHTNLDCSLQYTTIHSTSSKGKPKRTKMLSLICSEKMSKAKIIEAKPKKTAPKLKKPRLARKPGKDDHDAILKWASTNYEILIEYEKELKAVKRELVKADRERLAEFKTILGISD